MHHCDNRVVISVLALIFLLRLEFDLLRIRVPHRIKIWYCGHSFRSCACTCSRAEFLTRQSCNRTTAGLWLDKMRCTVEMEFWIPTGPTFWLTTLDCLDGVGGVPIQSIKSVAWSLHCQCLVLGTVSEVKTWWQNLWAFAGGNTSCTVCCFRSIRFTFLLPFLSVLSRGIQWVCAELSPSSEKNCCTGQSNPSSQNLASFSHVIYNDRVLMERLYNDNKEYKQ